MKPRLITPHEPFSPDDSAIVTRLQAAGYGIRRDTTHEIYYKLQLLFGERVDILRDGLMLPLFMDAQIRKGRAFTAAELRSLAKPRDEAPHFFALLQELVHQHVFLRGYNLVCPYCHSMDWHPLHMVLEDTTCRGCHAVFQPPLQLDFAYKPNELVVKGIVNGALTALLTLRWLQNRHADMVWGAGYAVKKDGVTTDLDLVVLNDGQLTVIECKDHVPDTIISEQIARLTQVTDDLGAGFMLATLQNHIPDMLMNITVLSSRDLLKG